MSSFSNTDTGNAAADPYTQKNLDSDVSVQSKVKQLVDFAEKQKFGLMATVDSSTGLIVSRCMALAGKDANGTELIFHANSESGKTDDLANDSNINISFLNTTYGEWASIAGNASIETDRAVVKKFYSPALKAWMGDLGDGIHDGSENDPRIVVIRVKAKTAQYAISQRSMIGGAIEVAKGIATGDAPSVNKLRYVSEDEFKQFATSGSL